MGPVQPRPPRNRLLIIGSGPSALMAKTMDLDSLDVVCMNNSWAAIPKPKEDISWWHYSKDFFPRLKFHREVGHRQMVPDKELKNLLEAKSLAWKRANIIDDDKGCYFGSEEVGGFVFMDIMSLLFKTQETCDRWEEFLFLGCDHEYDPKQTHFYGQSEKLHVSDDKLVAYFMMIADAARRIGFKLTIPSNNRDGLLWKGLFG